MSTVAVLNYIGPLNRIAAATSILRTRSEDTVRLENRGGTHAEFCQHVMAARSHLEKAAAELEKALA